MDTMFLGPTLYVQYIFGWARYIVAKRPRLPIARWSSGTRGPSEITALYGRAVGPNPPWVCHQGKARLVQGEGGGTLGNPEDSVWEDWGTLGNI